MTNAEQQQQMLAEGSEAADFIRTSIVQAAMNDRGAFGAHWQPCCSCGCADVAAAVGWRCRRCGTCACAGCLSMLATGHCSPGDGDCAAVSVPAVPEGRPAQPPSAAREGCAAEMTIGEDQVGGLVEEVSWARGVAGLQPCPEAFSGRLPGTTKVQRCLEACITCPSPGLSKPSCRGRQAAVLMQRAPAPSANMPAALSRHRTCPPALRRLRQTSSCRVSGRRRRDGTGRNSNSRSLFRFPRCCSRSS